jgi:hypothetical protein
VQSPIRFVLGEMFCAESETGRRVCIVTNTLDEDGQYGELIEIPSQERFAISRAALGADWKPMTCDGPWYVEQYSEGRDRADWSARVPDIEFVIALAKGARHRGRGEIIRYRTGNYISPLDLGRLRFASATRLP